MKSFISGNRFLALFASLVLLTFFTERGQAAQEGAKPPPPAVMKQIAPDLYFHFDYASSNSIIWATDEGVLVIDTLARIAAEPGSWLKRSEKLLTSRFAGRL